MIDPFAWQDGAACTDQPPELFFPENRTITEARLLVERARVVCADCAVRRDCLEFALRNHENFGVWGGMTPQERKAIRKQQARNRAS